MAHFSVRQRVLGGALLVAGTAVGAGMLALPIATASMGFAPALVALVVAWAMMMLSALVLCRLHFLLPVGTHLHHITARWLGATVGKVSAAVYVVLLSCLVAAYLSGLTSLLHHAVQGRGWGVAPSCTTFLLALLGWLSLAMDTQWLDRFNRVLMVALGVAYVGLVAGLGPHAHTELWGRADWSAMPQHLTIVVFAFGFHVVIPSLRRYIGSDEAKHVRWSLWLGSLVPLLAYVLWEGVVLGLLPLHGVGSLQQVQQQGQTVAALVVALGQHGGDLWLSALSHGFVTAAIGTSFLGVAMSLFDCLAETRWGRACPRWLVGAVTLLPPTLVVCTLRDSFMGALTYGGLCVAYLLIILPGVMLCKSAQPLCDGPPGRLQRWESQGLGVLLVVFGLWVVYQEILRTVLA